MQPRGAGRTSLAALLLASGCTGGAYTRLYHTEPAPPGHTLDEMAGLDFMGSTVFGDGVNFCVYSENATRVDLALFDDPESDQPTQQFEMASYGGIWNLWVQGVGEGQHYGYVAWGPNWEYEPGFYPNSSIGFRADVDGDGNRFDPNKLLTDPWARAYHRPHDWSRGSVATGPWGTESTWAAASKSIVMPEEDDQAWSDAEEAWREGRAAGTLEGHDWNELVIYEVHPKGFTANPASGVAHPGTYRGVGEMAGYLEDLGVTAVELLPVHAKEPSLAGYWGYSNLSWFAPELTYASAWLDSGEPDEVLDEFRGMVEALHRHGIEVILDVVYNHTGEGGLWEQKVYYGPDPAEYYTIAWEEVASVFNLRGLDNSTYYVVSADGTGFHDSTGVGHDVRANHPATRRLVLDSLRFYAEELHVDGFRFDLAAILGQVDGSPGEFDPTGTILQDIVDDPVLARWNTRFVAEPWSMASYRGWDALQGSYPSATDRPGVAWYEWNDAFRDWWRHFLNGPAIGYDWTWSSGLYWDRVDGGGTLTGTYAFYADKAPYNGVNFVTVHDGYTMYDLFSFDDARNFCGPLNPVCCDDPYSVWCDLEEPWAQIEHDWGDEDTKRRLMRNLFTVVMLSSGTPMILGGDEWMRTQYGNNNAYTAGADNSANWFRWGEWTGAGAVERHRMHDFVRRLVAFRKAHVATLSPTSWDALSGVSWLDAGGDPKSDWEDRHLAMLRDGGGEADVLLLVNGEDGDVTFALPPGSWGRVVDTGSWWDADDGYFAAYPDADRSTSACISDEPVPVSGTYAVASYAVAVLVSL